MTRKKLIYSKEFPYHVISRSNHKTWFHIPLTEVWRIVTKSLFVANKKFPIDLHAFVLMSNHYHMVLTTPDGNISDFMYEFNKNFSLELRIKSHLINRMFGGRYKWSLIQNQKHYYEVMKYVFLNPNKAGMTQDASDYEFSTLNIQKKNLYFPLTIKSNFNTLDSNFLNWVHSEHSEEQRNSISRGLKKSLFQFAGSRENRRVPHFDHFY
jgi:putative transposase